MQMRLQMTFLFVSALFLDATCHSFLTWGVDEQVTHASFSKHSLRVTEPDRSICDPDVKQHTGFLDIADDKHLFFW